MCDYCWAICVFLSYIPDAGLELRELLRMFKFALGNEGSLIQQAWPVTRPEGGGWRPWLWRGRSAAHLSKLYTGSISSSIITHHNQTTFQWFNQRWQHSHKREKKWKNLGKCQARKNNEKRDSAFSKLLRHNREILNVPWRNTRFWFLFAWKVKLSVFCFTLYICNLWNNKIFFVKYFLLLLAVLILWWQWVT